MSLCVVTRTQPGADVSTASLQALGYRAIALPAATIVTTDVNVTIAGVQALLMTSAAAARSTRASPEILRVPVYAVGDATALTATQAGFKTVISAGGDGATLAVLAADRMKPHDGALLHLRGNEVAGDVTGMLAACGFETRSLEVYATQEAADFGPQLAGLLANEHGAIVVHSPAGGRRVADAINGKPLDLTRWAVFGLSQACLEPLLTLGFGGYFAANRPDEKALLDLILLHQTHSRP